MTLITKTLTVALILTATASAGSAFARSAPTPELSATHINDWILKKTSAQNQSFILQTDIEDEAALFTPLLEQNPERFVKFETPIYSKMDISNFNYPLLDNGNGAGQIHILIKISLRAFT